LVAIGLVARRNPLGPRRSRPAPSRAFSDTFNRILLGWTGTEPIVRDDTYSIRAGASIGNLGAFVIAENAMNFARFRVE
jgi:hypothetical protein